ncbi:hypothetical protein AB0O07_35710 [Streptomyces sp. NPDC093085]|uniref:phage tail protein n=1 Tax=Streptomyces sp. NPDC093085 TaxID=3155068 RepID=UPI0034349E8E
MRTALIQASGALTRFRSALTQASSSGNRLRDSTRQNSAEMQRLAGSARQSATGVQNAARNAGASGGLFGRLTGGVRGASTAMRGLNTAMKANVMGAILALLIPLITKLVEMAMRSKTVQAVVQKAMQVMGQVMSATMRAGSAAIGWVVNAAKRMFSWLKANWPLLVAILAGPIGIAVLMIVKHWNRITSAVGAVRNAIVSKWNDAMGFLRGIPGRISKLFSGLAATLRNTGGHLIQGLINGIIGKASALTSTIKNFVIDKIPGPIRRGLGISSPSTLMMGFGRDVGEGLALGIEGTGNRVSGAAGRLATATARGLISPGYGLAGTSVRAAGRTGGAGNSPVTVHVHPRPGQSEYEIGRITARELAWAGKR